MDRSRPWVRTRSVGSSRLVHAGIDGRRGRRDRPSAQSRCGPNAHTSPRSLLSGTANGAERANGTLRHHLDVLQRRKDIRTVHVNGRTCYFLDEDPVARHGSQATQQLPIGLSRVQRAILIELQTEGPAASQAELARRIGRSRATVHSAVNVLRRRGILRHDALEFLPHL